MKEYFLEELLKIKNGRDHKHLPNGKIPVYGSGGLMRLVNQSIYNEESILLPRKGTLSNIQYVNKPFWTVDTIYYTIVNQEKANALYLYHYLKQLDLSYLNSGTGVPSMTFGAYYGVKVNLPELKIQQKIAKVLSDLDAKIELNNKINTELEAMAKTLYDYWFVQFDFPTTAPSTSLRQTSDDEKNDTMSEVDNLVPLSEVDNLVPLSAVEVPYKTSGGKMVWNEELKREIPEGWEIYSLSSLVNCNKWTIKKDNPYKKINYLDTSSITNNVIDNFQKINSDIDKIPSRAQRVVSKDDILYSTVRPNQYHFGIIKDPVLNMIASTGFAQLRSNSESISNDLIYTFLSSNIVTIRLQQIADTAVSAYPSISHNDILRLKIALPKSNEILAKINSFLDDIYSKTSLNHKENQQLASLRDWLLPMLMNGQVRVGDVEKVYKLTDEVLGMVAEGRAEYKRN